MVYNKLYTQNSTSNSALHKYNTKHKASKEYQNTQIFMLGKTNLQVSNIVYTSLVSYMYMCICIYKKGWINHSALVYFFKSQKV